MAYNNYFGNNRRGGYTYCGKRNNKKEKGQGRLLLRVRWLCNEGRLPQRKRIKEIAVRFVVPRFFLEVKVYMLYNIYGD